MEKISIIQSNLSDLIEDMRNHIEDCERKIANYNDKIEEIEDKILHDEEVSICSYKTILNNRFKIEDYETEIKCCEKYIDSVQYALSLIEGK